MVPEPARLQRVRSDAFSRAQRHSRNVRRLKFALPSIAVILAVGFAAFSVMSTPPSGPIAKQTAEVAEGELVMANPKLEGFTKDGQRYSMNAGRAVQDFEQQGVVTLHGIDANMPIDKDKWARVQTESGVFDRNANTLDVTTDITVTTSDGMVANLKSAFLDINNGNLKTSDPVDIQANGSKISAGSMSILDNGKRVIFESNVRLDIDPDQMKAAQAGKGDIDASN